MRKILFIVFFSLILLQQTFGMQLVVPPKRQAYVGAYVDFGKNEDNVTLEGLEKFECLVGKHQAVIGFSNYWGKQAFPSDALKVIYGYGAVALVYWNPWDSPFGGWSTLEGVKPGRFNLPDIVNGKWDNYIDMWAVEAEKFGKPMLVAWGLEMNGAWFPWSGLFYNQGPELYKKAYWHIVDRVRAKGADNIQWVFHANNTSDPNEPWNRMENYYPGSQYVDWLGLSAYGQQYPGAAWVEFQKVLPQYYEEICKLDPNKPFILAEWGVGEFPTGNKAQWYKEALQRMTVEFPRLKAMVVWHEQWQNGDQSISNLRVNSSLEALKAYKQGIANQFWLEYYLGDIK